MERKIVQISAVPGSTEALWGDVYALCNDGTVWVAACGPQIESANWYQLPPIPQPEPECQPQHPPLEALPANYFDILKPNA